MRAGLYAWVSTDEEAAMSRQNDALLAYVTARSWTAICRIEDIGSEAAARPRRAELMKLARRHALDVILVCRLDRWGDSLRDLVQTLQELNALGVGFMSLGEPLDLTTPSGWALCEMLAVFAEFERQSRRQQVKAGISRATTGAASWSSADRSASGAGDSSPGVATDESVRDRTAAGDRPDVGTEDSGGEELRSGSVAVGGERGVRVFICRGAV